MAVTSLVYNKAVTSLANKEVDWGTDTIKCMLVGSGYTVDQQNHQYLSSITSEVTGTGYVAGGTTLTNKTEAFAGQVKSFNADDAVWPNATITAHGAVVYDWTGNPATSPLLCYVDFGQDIPTIEGDFSVIWSTSGVFTATVATP